jgi:serine/threonine protein kinase
MPVKERQVVQTVVMVHRVHPRRMSAFQFFPAYTRRRMDLRPYGIEYELTDETDPERDLHVGLLQQGSFSKTQARFDMPSGTYSMGPMLGKGTYAESFQVTNLLENTVSVIKVLQVPRRQFHNTVQNIVKECLINILLERESADQPEGPYVPRFHEICFDPERSLVLLRLERLHGVLADVYNGATAEQNDMYVPETLGDLAHILSFFNKRLAFNHRDLKSDNVMYVYSPSGKLMVKLIDFGFACLTWEGVRISGSLYFPLTDKCFLPSRDLCQFVYEILLTFRKRFSPAIVNLLEDVLTFPLDDKVCKLFQKCQYNRLRVRRWLDTYDFLNTSSVRNPHTVPDVLYKRMMSYMGRTSPKRTSPVPSMDRTGSVPIRQCLPEQILNPDTGNCVLRSSNVGRNLMEATERRSPSPKAKAKATAATTIPEDQPTPQKPAVRRRATALLVPCKSYQMRNPKTRRCRNRCGPNKIRNPATGRCVTRRGRQGRELLAAGIVPSDAADAV